MSLGGLEQFSLDGLALNDGSVFTIESVDATPPQKVLDWLATADADGAILGTDPRFPNRAITIRLHVEPQASMDAALTQLGSVQSKLAKATQSDGGIQGIWTPAGSTKPVSVFVLNGEVTGLPISMEGADAGWLQSSPVVEIRLDCLPFLYGPESLAPLAYTDSFAFDSLSNGNWRFDSGSGTISVVSGSLVPSAVGTKQLYLPFTCGQCTVTLKFISSAAITGSFTHEAFAKRTDANNWLSARFWTSGNLLQIVKNDGGTTTAVASSSAYAITANAEYWVQLVIVGNVVTANLYASDPFLGTPAPVATISYTLAGSEAAKYGVGVRGNPGVRLTPNDTSWRYDDFRVTQMNEVTCAEPLVSFEIPGQAGDVEAEGRLQITELSGQERDHLEVGLESTATPGVWPVLLDSAVLVTLGFAGTQSTRSGAYDPGLGGNTVVSTTLTTSLPVVCCGVGNQPHIGTFRVRARVYGTSTAIRTRAAWRAGSAPLARNDYAVVGIANAFSELDLGTITIPAATQGTQRMGLRIEAYTDPNLGGVAGDTLDIDYIELIPAERYAVARSPIPSTPPEVFTARDEFNQTAGALTGKTLPTGQTWTVLSGSDADDFTVDATNHNVTRAMASADADLNTGRYLTGGTTSFGGIIVQVDAYWSSPFTSDVVRLGPIARVVDINNWLMAVLNINFAHFPYHDLTLYKRVAGTVTSLGSVKTKIRIATDVGRIVLRVDTSGLWWAWAFRAGQAQPAVPTLAGYDSDLAAGGALASGKVGIYDTAIGVQTAVPRVYDNFAAFVPVNDNILAANMQAEVHSDSAIRQDLNGYWGTMPRYRGEWFFVPPAGDGGRSARLAVKAKRNDVDGGLPDNQIADTIKVCAYTTPRYAVAPR